jgi:hypothetical protein
MHRDLDFAASRRLRKRILACAVAAAALAGLAGVARAQQRQTPVFSDEVVQKFQEIGGGYGFFQRQLMGTIEFQYLSLHPDARGLPGFMFSGNFEDANAKNLPQPTKPFGLAFKFWFGMSDDGVAAVVKSPQLEALEVLIARDLTDERLAIIAGAKNLRYLRLNYAEKLTGKGWEALGKHQRLQTLHVFSGGKGLAADAVHEIAKLPQLTQLVLDYDYQLDDAAIAPLAGAKRLTYLSLAGNNNITSAGLSAIAKLPQLKTLHLYQMGGLSPEVPKTLSTLPQLTELYVNDNWQLADAVMPELVKLKRVTRLNLQNNRLTNAGVAYLSAMPQLTELHLSTNLDVTDESIATLARLKNLKHLYLNQCKISAEGQKRLAAALPQCTIHP